MTLVEYGAPISIQLTEKEVESLRLASSSWRKKLRLKYSPLSISGNGNNSYLVTARGVAGFISVGDLHLEIIPKYIAESDSDSWKVSMWRFLSYGKGFNLFEHTRIGLSRQDGIVDLLAELFLSSVQGVNEIGYAISYKEVEVVGGNLVGYLNPERYDTFLPVTGELHLITDELSNDNDINQLLKWAGAQLEANVESNELRKRLMHWSEELSHVSDVKPLRKVAAQRLNNYSHLKPAVEISELLLDDLTVNFSQDFANVPGFLWDSDALFERAIFRLFKETLLSCGLRVVKQHLTLASGDNGQKLITIPDLLFKNSERIVFLGDAKYKNYKGRPSPEDFYQIMAGAALVGLDCAALIYPASGGELLIDEFTVASNQKPGRVYAVKIGINAFSSSSSLFSLKRELKHWIESILSSS
ncbi:5-methylcytosine restriction system specificity protein McrC [Pseudoalteromonas piscicida]|uniref:Restriction endonuclease n=1 Tax=Pseudoalteromonas piscicida TaxID=43662 RepID=A0A2A5JMD4_PSEO7|nr:hypothetical protein [Pseudoalteromonas piscicida]PCK30586.1 hypothetical protein CEX98_16560 [Pseudoalteromonas piscicida]